MDRRSFIATTAGGLFALQSRARAQPSGKVWRIGYIGNQPPETSPENARLRNVFLQSLHERGCVDGKNVVIEARFSEGRLDRVPGFVDDLIRLNVDVLIVGSGPGVRAAKQATQTIPIIMIGTSDPVGAGFVASLAHPGGNITGVSDNQLDLVPKRLELLKSAAPGIRRVGSLHGLFSGFDAAALAATRERQDAAARALGMTLVRVEMRTPQDLETALAALRRERLDALMLSPNPNNFQLRNELAEFALQQRLPTVAASRAQAAAGIMITYGPDSADFLRKTADFVDRILRGANPGDLPVEQPTKFEFVINVKTAQALNLTIPQSLLLRADEVIR